MFFSRSRTSLDYAYACAFALKRAKLQTTLTAENSHIRGKITSSVKQGLQTKRSRKMKLNVLRSTRISTKRETLAVENARSTEKHATKGSEREHKRINHAGIVNDHAQTLAEHVEAPVGNVGRVIKHAEKTNEHAKNANEHAKGKEEHETIQEIIPQKEGDGRINVLCNRTGKKRKRSRQFKNVLFYERKRIKTRCVQLLSTL